MPVHDDRLLFEFLILEGAQQAGLSWETILKKRENYRRAFDRFEVAKVARYTEKKIAALLQDAGIVRNKLKVNSAVTNARAFLKVQEEFGTFDAYIWRCVEGKPTQNAWKALKQIPASTKVSDAMSKDLKQRGFRFVGTTICYAHMQATGMVNDHITSCHRHAAVAALSKKVQRVTPPKRPLAASPARHLVSSRHGCTHSPGISDRRPDAHAHRAELPGGGSVFAGEFAAARNCKTAPLAVLASVCAAV